MNKIMSKNNRKVALTVMVLSSTLLTSSMGASATNNNRVLRFFSYVSTPFVNTYHASLKLARAGFRQTNQSEVQAQNEHDAQEWQELEKAMQKVYEAIENEESFNLQEIWTGEEYEQIKDILAKAMRTALDVLRSSEWQKMAALIIMQKRPANGKARVIVRMLTEAIQIAYEDLAQRDSLLAQNKINAQSPEVSRLSWAIYKGLNTLKDGQQKLFHVTNQELQQETERLIKIFRTIMSHACHAMRQTIDHYNQGEVRID